MPISEGHTPDDPADRIALAPLDQFEGSLSGKVYQSLKAAIMSLAYPPGSVLRKTQICSELGVSRSPVSEAITRLAAEGLVKVVPQAGTYVARFSMDDIREGAFLREALEVAAVEHLARIITGEQIAKLQRNLRIQSIHLEDGDTAGFYELDGELHRMLLDFTGYRRLARLAETSWVQVNRARQLLLPEPGRMESTLAEHRTIVDALQAHDPQAARAATRTHLRQLIKFLEPLEQAHPEWFEGDQQSRDRL